MARSISDDFPGRYPERLTRAGAHVANQLAAGLGKSIIAPFDLYELTRSQAHGVCEIALGRQRSEDVTRIRTELHP